MISALPTFLGSVRSPAVPCVCCLRFYIVVGVFTFLWVYLHFFVDGRLTLSVGVHPSGRFYFYIYGGRFYIGGFLYVGHFIYYRGHFISYCGRFYMTVGILYITVGILFHCFYSMGVFIWGRFYMTVGILYITVGILWAFILTVGIFI
jgi:hypothetical protein